MDAKCRLCSLIPGFDVKLSAIILAGPAAQRRDYDARLDPGVAHSADHHRNRRRQRMGFGQDAPCDHLRPIVSAGGFASIIWLGSIDLGFSKRGRYHIANAIAELVSLCASAGTDRAAGCCVNWLVMPRQAAAYDKSRSPVTDPAGRGVQLTSILIWPTNAGALRIIMPQRRAPYRRCFVFHAIGPIRPVGSRVE
jgi:hypothetical protein